jgi:hypothetical protein
MLDLIRTSAEVGTSPGTTPEVSAGGHLALFFFVIDISFSPSRELLLFFEKKHYRFVGSSQTRLRNAFTKKKRGQGILEKIKERGNIGPRL